MKGPTIIAFINEKGGVGKTTSVLEFASQLGKRNKKVLVVVPTTSLVEQMYKDFEQYSLKDDQFDVNEDVHRIYSGKEKLNFEQSVVVTTWQSAIKLPPNWFLQYGMVIGDEAHTFKAKSLTTIMNRLINANMRIGTTGTIDDAVSNQMTLEGNFGPIYKVTTTKELIDSDTLAQLQVQCLVLKYPDEIKKQCFDAKMDAFLSKPIDIDSFDKIINLMLKKI